MTHNTTLSCNNSLFRNNVFENNFLVVEKFAISKFSVFKTISFGGFSDKMPLIITHTCNALELQIFFLLVLKREYPLFDSYF